MVIKKFLRKRRNQIVYHFNRIKKYLAWKTADYYFVSFPKSGRTWIRTFLAKYFSLFFEVDFDDEFYHIFRSDSKMPKLIITHYGIIGQLLKCKKEYSWYEIKKKNIEELKNKKIIFLVRDPRDIVVSYYFQLTKRRNDEYLLKNKITLKEFIRDERFGLPLIIDYLNFWYDKKDSFNKFLLVRYEDCKNNSEKEFIKILSFINLNNINKSVLQKAMNYSSFDHMKKLEVSGEMSDRLKPMDTKDKDSYKVRRGKVGGYEDYFDEEDLEYSKKQIEKLNKDFGYKN